MARPREEIEADMIQEIVIQTEGELYHHGSHIAVSIPVELIEEYQEAEINGS